MTNDDRIDPVQEKRCGKKTIAGLFLCLLFLAGASGAGFFWVRETPRYSLYCFKKAILSRDAEGVLKYLDTDAIVDNMVSQMSEGTSGEQSKSLPQTERPRSDIGRDIIVQNLPSIKQQLREQLRSVIVSYNDRMVLDKLSKASVFGLRIRRDGNTATVRVLGKDEIAFTMAKSAEGYWKISSLNLKTFL